jgi:hypothetical protein
VVDEKMWDNDEDDLEEMNQEEEKFEDNSKMAGEKLDDEMRTKDEAEDGSDENGKQEHDASKDAPDDSAEDNGKDESENINHDTEDKYEESHGLDVRDEQKAAEETDEQDLDLNDGLDIDDDPEVDQWTRGMRPPVLQRRWITPTLMQWMRTATQKARKKWTMQKNLKQWMPPEAATPIRVITQKMRRSQRKKTMMTVMNQMLSIRQKINMKRHRSSMALQRLMVSGIC